MPILFLFIGIMLIISGAKGTTQELGALIKEDFAPSDGSVSFGAWLVALLLVGAMGYIPKVKPLANSFIVLIFVGMMLSNTGFFKQFTDAVRIGK